MRALLRTPLPRDRYCLARRSTALRHGQLAGGRKQTNPALLVKKKVTRQVRKSCPHLRLEPEGFGLGAEQVRLEASTVHNIPLVESTKVPRALFLC